MRGALRYTTLSLLILTFSSCKRENKFERENELKEYLEKQHEYVVSDAKYVIVVYLTSSCQICTDNTLELLKWIDSLAPEKNIGKVLLYSENNKSVVDENFVDSNYNVFFKNNLVAGRHGISFASNFIVLYQDNGEEVSYWDWITAQTDIHNIMKYVSTNIY